MYPREHLKYGVIAATVAAIAGGVTEAGLFLAATTLIDVDHYLRYLYVAKKMARLKTAHTYYMAVDAATKKLGPGVTIPKGMYFLHTVEVLALLAAVSVAYPVLWWAFAGGMYHMLLDAIDCRRRGINYTKYISIIGYLARSGTGNRTNQFRGKSRC